jgi:aryl-alcohol dehydrogenase-like predicted oxidoreductase
METRQFGKTDMQVSVLGFGGSEIRGAEPSSVEQVLNTALDAGINVIDTAACYGNSEDLIGRAVSSRRNDYFLFTKCGHAVGEDLPDLPDWDPRLIEASIERSLRRLRTDHLDLLQLHSCSIDVLRKGDVIKVLEKAKREGKTRYIGYSGDNENARYAIDTGAFDTLQTSVSIADQQGIDFTVPKAEERGMGIIAKRPIANSAWLSKTLAKDAYGYPYWERLQMLDYDFLKGSANDSLTRAIRFTLSVPGVDVAIVGTTDPTHIRENIDMVATSKLSEEDYNAIRAVWQERSDPHWLTQG